MFLLTDVTETQSNMSETSNFQHFHDNTESAATIVDFHQNISMTNNLNIRETDVANDAASVADNTRMRESYSSFITLESDQFGVVFKVLFIFGLLSSLLFIVAYNKTCSMFNNTSVVTPYTHAHKHTHTYHPKHTHEHTNTTYIHMHIHNSSFVTLASDQPVVVFEMKEIDIC